jgi:hypothetical protein
MRPTGNLDRFENKIRERSLGRRRQDELLLTRLVKRRPAIRAAVEVLDQRHPVGIVEQTV